MLQLEVTGKYFRDATLINAEKFLLSVLRAHNLPAPNALSANEGRFYVTVTSGEKTWQTRSLQSVDQHVEWNEKVDVL
jgi:Ser/Thr protein kinase RdoA (MazF antagonist)